MKLSIMCLGASIALAAPAAIAGESGETVTTKLYFDYTELVTAEGAKENYKSLKRQAGDACKISFRYGSTTDRECVETMLDDAVEQIDSPILTAVHEGTELPLRLASK